MSHQIRGLNAWQFSLHFVREKEKEIIIHKGWTLEFLKILKFFLNKISFYFLIKNKIIFKECQSPEQKKYINFYDFHIQLLISTHVNLSQLSFSAESTLPHYTTLSVLILRMSIQSFIGSHLLLRKSACWLSTLCLHSTWPFYLNDWESFAKPSSEFCVIFFAFNPFQYAFYLSCIDGWLNCHQKRCQRRRWEMWALSVP